MFDILENWNKFLKEEKGLGSEITKLYHYCGRCEKGQESVVLDPQRGRDQPGSYSRREYETSQVPRVFFYLDPADRESMVSGPLYSVEVPTPQIYNLWEDENKYIRRIKEKREEEKYWYGSISQPLRKGEDWNNLFYLIMEEGYKGVYYKPGFEAVVWLEPIVVTLNKQEEE